MPGSKALAFFASSSATKEKKFYNLGNLIADIGGYLGLFLGLSVYSLFEIVEAVLERIKSNDKKLRNKTDLELAIK